MTMLGASDRRRLRKVRKPYKLSAFTGWNDENNHAAMLDTDLRIAKNVCLYRADLIGGRFGSHRDPFAAALNSGVPVTGMFDFKSAKDTVQRPIFIAGNKIYAESSGADPSTATDVTGTAVTIGSQNALTSGVVFNDTLIMTQRGGTGGTHVPFSIAGTGNAAPLSGWFTNNRTCEYVHAQFNYLFFAGFNREGSPTTPQNSMNVAYSELNVATAGWDDTRFVEKIGGLSAYGDEYVTGMFRHRDFLMVGTNKRIYPVTYTGNTLGLFAIQRPLDVGLASQHSVVSINGEFTFFMDPYGNIHAIHELTQRFGAVGVQSVSRKIKNYISGLSRSMIKYVTATFDQNRGWAIWSVPNGAGATAKNELLVLDVNDFPLDEPDHRIAKFHRWTGISANSMAMMTRDSGAVASSSEPSATGEPYIYFGTQTGWVKRFTDTISYDESDAGAQTVIESEIATKYFDFASPDEQKSVVEVRWNMEPASSDAGPTAAIEYDFGARRSNSRVINMDSNLSGNDLLDSTFILDTSRLGSEESVTTSKDYFKGAGTHASVRLNKALAGTQKWKLQQFAMLVEQRGETTESAGGAR